MPATHTNSHDYRVAVTNPTEREVLDALADERWDFRSPGGIASTTGVPEEEVRAILDHSEYVQVFNFPNRTGEPVYALRYPGRLRKLRQYRQIFLTYVAREAA